VPSDPPYVDIGCGVSYRLRYVDGELDGVEYKHPCKDGWPSWDYVPVKPAWPEGWDVPSVDPLTLTPSLQCRVCGHHGHITAGRWAPA
jgi:hypothetical protein